MMASDQEAGRPILAPGHASRAAIIQGSPEAPPMLSQGSKGAR